MTYELPAPVIPPWGYFGMYENCSSLIYSPDIKASTITSMNCCCTMFRDCTNLSIVRLSNFTGLFNNHFVNWLYNVSPTGIFYYEGIQTQRSTSSIPENWELAMPTPLCFTAATANAKLKLVQKGTPTLNQNF